MEIADVIVAGGGIIGLSAALEMARRGFHVRVLERGSAMAEASWAAAGMLATNDPDHPAALSAFASLSGRLYPDYLRVVAELSGRPVPLRTRASLLGGLAADAVVQGGFALNAEEAARRVPGLAGHDRKFWWIEEASLDPRDLCVALPMAARAAGVDIEEDTAVLSVSSQDGSVAVTTCTRTLHAGAFVNCCGAWAGQVRYGGSEDAPTTPVEPRKGQMVAVQLPRPLDLPCVVRTPQIYLVPRGGGRVVIGATVERAGFDRSLDPEALSGLLRLASEVWPPIVAATVLDSWSGLRPGTPDALPLLGGTGEPHCWVATGHFRNGILLAPATALLVRQLVEGSELAIDLAGFRSWALGGRTSGAVTRFRAVGYKTDRLVGVFQAPEMGPPPVLCFGSCVRHLIDRTSKGLEEC